jgi:streptomycin 6-kinase
LLTIEDDAQATRIAAAALRRLWRPAPATHPFTLLADAAARWSRDLPREFALTAPPINPGVLAEGLYALEALGPDRDSPVVLHQDLHAGNILAAEREPWLVIDPKPLVGPREFDVASLLRDRRPLLLGPDGPRMIRRRLDILADELPVDREKMRLWGIAHAFAWGLSSDGTPYQGHMRAAEILHALR